jgi:putative methyltransferase (TIGR04325 family)
MEKIGSTRSQEQESAQLLAPTYEPFCPPNATEERKRKVAALSGYQDRRLVEVVFAKTIAFDPSSLWETPRHSAVEHTILGVRHAAANNPNRPLRVLDFGGACGFHYRVARAAIPDLPLQWAVVETPAMAERAAELSTEVLGFFADIDSALKWLGAVDLMHSLGAIEYVPDPERSVRELCALEAPTLLWSRMDLTDGATKQLVQRSRLADHGPGPLPADFRDCEVSCQLTN